MSEAVLAVPAKAPGSSPPVKSPAVREQLVEALRLDLVGPPANHALAEERLPRWERPSKWYLTGFLIPSGAALQAPEQSADADEGDDLAAAPETAGLPEESAEERRPAKRAFFPSSIGLSFLVRPGTEALEVTVRWGDYSREPVKEKLGAEDRKNPGMVWRRRPNEQTVPLPLSAPDTELEVPDSGGLRIHAAVQPIGPGGGGFREIPAGTRSVSVFLVNYRRPDKDDPDPTYAFQAEIEVQSESGFFPRPDLRGAAPGDWDDEVAHLHYFDTPEYAVGHGVSADWEVASGNCCRRVRTAWIPRAAVEKTASDREILEAEFSMEALGKLEDGTAAAEALEPLAAGYRDWIEESRGEVAAPSEGRRETAEELLRQAGGAADRIEAGVRVLAGDPDALHAFRVANRAVAKALRRRLKDDPKGGPRWRAFQLAFILLNIPGLADPHHGDREIADLLFFPTGGGKTEAYLGLAAFVIVLRRLRNPGDGRRAGAGVSVIMRYTLRLLTLDQLARASGMICALELEREADSDRYGEWRFEIGLWVGKAATPNILGRKGDRRSDSARVKARKFKANPDREPLPIPLANCPWCGEPFAPDSFTLCPDDDKPSELRIFCVGDECDFRERALPILGVDEPIYRRLPAFLIATVDKFAALPWTAESGGLLGGATRRDRDGFYGAAEPRHGDRLAAPLPPPDLIIQDELHLISGPLGTMVGLYEAAIGALTVRGNDGNAARPKIIASTATARQAQDQIQAVFARKITRVFPPPGPGRRDSFFARTIPEVERPARLYLGIAGPGRSAKVVMRRVVLALMGAAQRAYRDAGGGKNPDNPADPYMTLLAYFNSLRELGGARRILEEEVQNTIKEIGRRKRIGETNGLFRDRKRCSFVRELTSRVSTGEVAEVRRRLGLAFHKERHLDWAIATNMISVGLDIPRLGLMLVLGQPKTHAEYIQATSRVGRDDRRPGLVVTLLSAHKPRDRSHYERFRHYHETFYRSVEAASVTPFSARALDRGLAGALVALARHTEAKLTPAAGAEKIVEARARLEPVLLDAFRDRVDHQRFDDDAERQECLHSVRARIVELLDAWETVAKGYLENGVHVRYQKHEGRTLSQPLLREMLDTEFETEKHALFRVNRSLRDVEPQVNLYIQKAPQE